MKRMFKKGRSYTLVEILIAAAIFALVVRLLYGVYTKVIVGTGSEQNRLIRLVSHARLASRVINWELTNAHELVTPENKDDVSRTAHTLVYFDSSDCLSLIELEKGNLIKKNFKVCTYCGYHFRMSSAENVALLTDKGTFEEIGEPIHSIDTLNFKDTIPYKERLKTLKETVGLPNAILTGKAKIQSMDTAIGVFSFHS
jgi:hypothetical protein